MNDLTKKSVEELKKLEEESRAELFALRFQSSMGNLEKPHRIGELKKQIARILTILSARKNTGENTIINVKVNLNETYAKIEKESQEFAKQRKAKIDQMMVEQQAAEGKMENLMDLTEEQTVALTITGEENVIDEQKTPSDKTTVTIKSATSAKVDIEVSKLTKKTESTKTVKKATELNAKEKLAVIKSSVGINGVVKERNLVVKNDLESKSKDLNSKECTYGSNWKENRDKILISDKKTKKVDNKITKKGTGKK